MSTYQMVISYLGTLKKLKRKTAHSVMKYVHTQGNVTEYMTRERS
jgi:ATP-dependent Clp protease adapter protein ClpS